MGAIYPTSPMFNPQHNWLFEGGCKSTIWTKEENKKFESALAIFDENTPDRWFKVASILPGKSVLDVMKQYEELIEDVSVIEAGLVPTPGYLSSPFTLDWVDDTRFDHFRKRSNASLSRPSSDHERKKGVPWTEDEHRRFLLGLQKQGKGDWRNISRNYVITKTPTQVASHAQKYFLRQNSGVKDKKRPSIHDITTANISESSPPLSDFDQKPNLQKSINIVPKMVLDWRNSNGDAFMVFNSRERQNLYSGAYQGAYVCKV